MPKALTKVQAVCLGFDAMRLALGKQPKNFKPMQIVGLLERKVETEFGWPRSYHPAVLDAHAQFGGDLKEMQRAFDKQEPLPAALATKENSNAEAHPRPMTPPIRLKAKQKA